MRMRTLMRAAGALAAILMIVLIQAYRLLLRPLLPQGCCRHMPTCSRYALEAVSGHGPWTGAGLALGRLLRCHPWGTMGHDPVPPPRAAAAGRAGRP